VSSAATIGNVYTLVLAAGRSQRFGSNKLLIEIDRMPLVRHAMQTAEAACGGRSLLVVGHDWQAVAAAAAPQRGFLLRNEHYATGMGSSLALGSRALAGRADAIVVLLADQPLVDAGHIAELIDRWHGNDRRIVASAYADTAGAPVLLPSSCFGDLAGLEGDAGARRLIGDDRFETATVACAAGAVDIDTPDDVRPWRNARN